MHIINHSLLIITSVHVSVLNLLFIMYIFCIIAREMLTLLVFHIITLSTITNFMNTYISLLQCVIVCCSFQPRGMGKRPASISLESGEFPFEDKYTSHGRGPCYENGTP
jgi:hypothetical protein